MAQPQIGADAIRKNGAIAGVSISKILGCDDSAAALFAPQLAKPLDDDEIQLMLSNQAVITNAIANRYLQQSVDLSDHARELSGDYMRIALKSFELSKKALVALDEIRNPKQSATFIKNQNNLLNQNQNNGKPLDSIGEGKATEFNPDLEAVEIGRGEEC